MRYVDPDGRFWDVVWDIGWAVYDLGSAIYKSTKGDHSGWSDVGFDIAAALIPCVPAGLNKIDDAYKAVDHVVDVANAVDNVGDTLKAGDKLGDVAKSAKRADFYVKPNGETVPGTMYRYSDSSTFEGLSKTKSGKTSYVTPQKFDASTEAVDGLQINVKGWGNDCRTRSSFDSLQVIDDVKVPMSKGGKGTTLEPITNSYPEYGKGGYPQYKIDKIINFDSVDRIP